MANEKKRNKRTDAFWRATRYLGPHRGIVMISVLCALVVGIAFTSGLGTMLPIMQVLVNGQTIPDWANRKLVEHRLGVTLADDVTALRVNRVADDGWAKASAVKRGDVVAVDGAGSTAASLGALADPARPVALVRINGGQVVRADLPAVPWYLMWGRDLAMRLPGDPIRAIGVVLGFLLALSVFGNVVRFFQEYLSEKAAVLAVSDIRRKLYDHVLHLPLSFFGTSGTSDVTSRLTADAQGLQDGMKQLLGNSIQEPIKAAMALGLAIAVSWQLTLFIILFGPLMFLLIKKFGKKIRRTARAQMQSSSSMLGQIEGSLLGIRVVKAAGAERYERRRFRGITNQLVGFQLRIARLEAFNTPVLELCTLVVVCVIVLYASYLVLRTHAITNTEFFLVMACLMGIGESLRKVSKINNILQKSNAAAARLFEIIDLPVERPRQANSLAPRPRKQLAPIGSEVRFENVTFTYPGASGPALQGVSLEVPRGQSVAVVGRNGSGKTTLLALLPRFYDPQGGRITVDGLDLREVTLGSLRRQIGIVTQDSVIFPGSIADNIAYGQPRAKRDEIVAAARRAFAHDFILEKPQGYDTVLGEHGAQLSGGQKQRLCIARAILRQTPILILDEATSQVDAESEHLIQQAIESIMHERTTFVIAHRFSTILSADRIVVMDKGQIVGMGKHEELLTTCPTYKQLYERQLGA